MLETNVELIEKCFDCGSNADELCDRSIKKYRHSLKRFFDLIGEKDIASINVDDINRYISIRKKRGGSNSDIVGVYYAIKWIIINFKKYEIMDIKIDFSKVIKPKIKKMDVNYLTKEEIKKFFGVIEAELEQGRAVRKLRAMALYVFLLETGARIDEALSVKKNAINFKDREIPIIGKGNKPRVLLFHEQSEKWLKSYMDARKDDNEYLFVTRSGDSKWSYNDVCRSFQRYRRLSGISKKFTIHTFRHSFATQLLLNGVPLNQVSFLLGHANLETTMKYYIGTIRIEEAKKLINDSHFDFIPESDLPKND